MAEQLEEEIIIIDEADAAGIEEVSQTNGREASKAKEPASNKKTILIAGAAAAVLVVLIIVLLLVMLGGSEEKQKEKINLDRFGDKISESSLPQVQPSELERMIAKANMLYANGNKNEALVLYKKIALYSEAISHYNLGVAQLKEGQYATALESFKNAIKNGENRCVSAINAAVCSRYLENEESFRYYIDLAFASLPYELDSPLYSYYYALINYYKKNYMEALTALRHKSSDEYPEVQGRLRAKIDSLLGNYYDAISALEGVNKNSENLSLGLLYANVGDLTLAKQYLSDAVLNGNTAIEPQLALVYVYLKSGLIEDAGTLLRTVTEAYGEAVYKPYPIRVSLRDSLFDAEAAQNVYRNQLRKNRSTIYQKLFYFAPYKVFNAEQTISYIRKGNANIYIDDISSAKEYLQKSRRSSTVNYGIAKAIQKSLTFRLREANSELLKMIETQPKHSILRYNLALTYAQLGDMQNAYTHFLRSYHLDANNYLSGIFALLCAQLTGTPAPKLLSIIKENLSLEEDTEETDLYRTLLQIADGNYLGAINWLETGYKERPLYLVIKMLIASEVGRLDIAAQNAKKLTYLLPRDILPHLLYIDTHFSDLDNKAYAAKVINYLKMQDFHFEDLYFGSHITRYLYVQNALMTGKLYPLVQQLKTKLETTNEDPQGITNALALTLLYNRRFEESYLLYNQLIDDYKQRDTDTLFMASVASTAAEHHANAIALLELSKLKDPSNMESRYALGLLYIEAKNNMGAAVQFGRIGNSGFTSDYFNFNINTDLLLFERNQAQHNAKAAVTAAK